MDIVIAYKSETPIYEQIYDQISSQIINGELPADFCLPSIRAISKDLNISVITVKNAWELLESNGFIYTQAGKGCFVKAHTQKHLDEKKTILAKKRLKEDIEYYKNLGLSYKELSTLIKEIY